MATEKRPTILAVDDEAFDLVLVETILEDQDYRVVTSSDGREALEKVESERPDAVLLDVMMPGMDGFEVCRRLKSSRRTFFIPVVILTALADVESKVTGLDVGTDDFLNKPINRIELLTRLRALLRIHGLRDELDSTESVMLSMVNALEAKHSRTRDHSLRVAALVAAVVERLRLPISELESLLWGALLHDIGKMGVPGEILDKPFAERSLDEHRFFRLHPLYSERIIKPLESISAARAIIRHHHERLDGSGYPDRLEGAAFTPPIEVVAAAKAFDKYRMAAPGELERWSTELRREAESGKFHRDLVGGVLRAAAKLPEELPQVIDLLPVPRAPAGGRVYLADDSETNREIYREHLAEEGYRVSAFPDGRSLLAAVEERPPDLLLADVRMPDVGGEEICRRLKATPRFRYLPISLVTAYEEVTSKERALANGADEFLTVPVNSQELLARVRSLRRLGSYHQDLEEHENVVLSLSGVLEAKDPYTNGHSVRVGESAERIAREMKAPLELVGAMKGAGLLHDIGKIAVPDQILHKNGPLTDDEFRILMEHPTYGYEICKDLRGARAALPCIRHHHERYDGGGYPDGLTGDAIPPGGPGHGPRRRLRCHDLGAPLSQEHNAAGGHRAVGGRSGRRQVGSRGGAGLRGALSAGVAGGGLRSREGTPLPLRRTSRRRSVSRCSRRSRRPGNARGRRAWRGQ